MSKEYSGYLKGIAIMMMLFLHLFNNLQNDLSLGYLLEINDTPFIFIITRMCNSVPFFLILSRYGLYATYCKSGGINPLRRTKKLYYHLWLIYLFLLPLASYIMPEQYPGTFSVFVKNATSWQCSYIGEQWFFLPYIILMGVSKWIFQLFDRMNWCWVLIISLAVYGFTLVVLKMFGEEMLCRNILLYNPFLALYMLLPFTFGYLARRFEWIEWFGEKLPRKSFAAVALVFLCILRCCIPNAFIDPVYAIAFIMLFATLPVANVTASVLSHLGKHSMNMWLIHTWFSARLFHAFFYENINNPILMYGLLVVVSLLLSYVVEISYRQIGRIINRISTFF